MNNQECKTRPQVIMLMEMNLCFFHLLLKQVNVVVVVIILTIGKICVPDVAKNLNVKVFNYFYLMSRTNETKFIKWHESCKCECKFGENVCNNKQRSNKNKCRCECKELIDKRVCDKDFIWNPSNCECERDKTCDIGEYLDENCKCRKKLVDKLIDECTETVEEVKLAKIALDKNANSYKCSSSTVYIVLMIVVFTIFTGITVYFVYYN